MGAAAYDMKGALAAMLLSIEAMRDQDQLRVRLGIVGDEESEEESERGSDHLVDGGFTGDFAITGEPTDLHIGIEAKGVLALRLAVSGTAAHGATPWLGDNAVLNAIDVFRSIESLPFARHSSELFDRPSINLGRIWGGDALNKVPDRCVIDVDIRYLPDQDPAAILEQVARPGRGQRGTAVVAPSGDRGPRLPAGAGASLRRRRPPGRRADERRARRCLRCGFLPAGRGAGGGVRPDRRGSPRSGGVGLDRLAARLPPDPGGLSPRRPGALQPLGALMSEQAPDRLTKALGADRSRAAQLGRHDLLGDSQSPERCVEDGQNGRGPLRACRLPPGSHRVRPRVGGCLSPAKTPSDPPYLQRWRTSHPSPRVRCAGPGRTADGSSQLVAVVPV